MSKGKIKTIVCGSTFGQFYIEALKTLPDSFEIVGLLANGSERSKECAHFYHIPLFQDIDQIDEVDLACVVLRSRVMGGKGTDISLSLIERGIPVIQESPLHQSDIAVCLRACQKNQTPFMTGNHYLNLPAVKRFIACAKKLNLDHTPLFLDISLATQVSYPLIHILFQVLPKIRPFKIHQVIKESGPFQLLVADFANIPMTLRAHNEVNPNDPDNYLHLLHHISIGYQGGTLSLTDTHGPVVWRPRLHTPKEGTLGGLSVQDYPHLQDRSTVFLGPISPPSYNQILSKQWPRAISQDILLMKKAIQEKMLFRQRSAQELLCSEYWHDLTNALGYPILRPDAVFKRVFTEPLQTAANTVILEKEEREVLHA